MSDPFKIFGGGDVYGLCLGHIDMTLFQWSSVCLSLGL